MAHGTSDQVAAQWAARLGQSGQKITDGVNAVKVSPGQSAAKQSAVWIANLQASQQKWAARVGAVALTDWQNAMIQKGVARIGQGATQAQPKMSAFLAKFLPYVDNAKASLPPRGSYAQNVQRMTTMIDKLHGFKR